METMMRRVLLVATALACAVWPALAQEGPEWAVGATAQNGWLLYGIPFSDDVVIRFSCSPASTEVSVAYRLDPPQGEEGDVVPVKLLRAGNGLVIDGEITHLAAIEVYLLEATFPVEGIMELFGQEEGDALLVATPFEAEELPMPQADDIEVFLSACAL